MASVVVVGMDDFFVADSVLLHAAPFLGSDNFHRVLFAVFLEQEFQVDVQDFGQGQEGVDGWADPVAFDLRDKAFAYAGALGDDL